MNPVFERGWARFLTVVFLTLAGIWAWSEAFGYFANGKGAVFAAIVALVFAGLAAYSAFRYGWDAATDSGQGGS